MVHAPAHMASNKAITSYLALNKTVQHLRAFPVYYLFKIPSLNVYFNEALSKLRLAHTCQITVKSKARKVDALYS